MSKSKNDDDDDLVDIVGDYYDAVNELVALYKVNTLAQSKRWKNVVKA